MAYGIVAEEEYRFSQIREIIVAYSLQYAMLLFNKWTKV